MVVQVKNKINSVDGLNQKVLEIADSYKDCIEISLCSGSGCKAYLPQELYRLINDELTKNNKKNNKRIVVRRTGCLGYCEKGPIIIIYPQEICYLQVKAEDIPEIVEKTLNGEVVDRLLYKDEDGASIMRASDIPFYKFQHRVIIDNNSRMDPKNIDDYIRLGGYQALAKALATMTPNEVLDEVKKANLRGRGGGGFPAGSKWETTKNAQGEPKYVIVNASEGNPGAFLNRLTIEGNPHSVLEGLILAAYAIDSNQGYIYIKKEYTLAIENINEAIEQARDYGFLGKNIFNCGFNFEVDVHKGAGAYVSGESSALNSAIEGKVGEPKMKYIHTSVSGLWGKPTNLNNVETYANVPQIINNGSGWFTGIGTKSSPGTKIFSLVGKVKNTGLVEVPMGITLRDIIYKIGSGIKNNKKFKAVQTGGPSGGVIPEKLLDLPVDFDELTKAGSMMGSGGMIVMDEDDCMVELAYYFIKFLSDESCGKCVPCREGLKQLIYIYERIINGDGRMEDLKLLEDLAVLLEGASLCALGTSAPNIILTTLKYFGQEYDAHIQHNSCPAMVCKLKN
jgi:NADP-reducing hydrogenase subunit HndC